MSNEKDFLGKGLRFPVSINLNGGVSSSQLEENVRQSLFVILGTAPGERVNRPKFGCMIHDLMFAPNNPVTAASPVRVPSPRKLRRCIPIEGTNRTTSGYVLFHRVYTLWRYGAILAS